MELTNLDEGCSMNNSNSSSTIVTPESEEANHIFNVFACLTIVLIALASFVGNLAVIIVSSWEQKLRNQTGNILIVFLASIDVLTSIFVMMHSAITMAVSFWPFGEIACRINAVFNYMRACSSSHTAAMMSFDRTIAVVYPLKYKSMMTAKVMISICVWILINTGSCATFVGATPWISYDSNEAGCPVTYSEYLSKVFIYCDCAFCYFIPALFIGICNVIILIQIRRSSKVMSEHITTIKLLVFEQNMKKRKDMEMRKSMNSMMAIVIVYFFSLTPYSIIKQGKAMTSIDAPPWLNYTTTILMFISSAINSFIYGILHKDYRDGFKKRHDLLRSAWKIWNFSQQVS